MAEPHKEEKRCSLTFRVLHADPRQGDARVPGRGGLTVLWPGGMAR